MTSKCKTCGRPENEHWGYRYCLDKTGKKFKPEDVLKEIINPMKDMVRNGKDWKQKGCGKDLSGNWKCGEMFEGKPLLCPECKNQSPKRTKTLVNPEDKPEDVVKIYNSSGVQTLSDKRFWLEGSQTQNKKSRKGSYKKKLSYKSQPRYFEKDLKQSIKKLTELLVIEWEIDDEETERQLLKIFGEKLV